MKQYVLILGLFLVLAIFSCTNPFTTRANQVEKPKLSDVEFLSPNTPENVMNNFTLAVQKKDVVKYIETFSPEPPYFHFEPDPHYFEDFQALNWGIENERDFFDQLAKSVVSMYFSFDQTDALVLLPIDVTAPDDSVFTDFTSYEITVNFSQEQSSSYRGVARFKLRHNHQSQRWYIYYWQDRAADDQVDLSMTALKLFFNQKTL